ncbi:P-loop containing nucleoside triphosphate hydrolase protein [Annulohypoxylon nitens]|nr:P-loop containing nucleoside triphosphate hydrolase protein [Annulohypoxylon nitens]
MSSISYQEVWRKRLKITTAPPTLIDLNIVSNFDFDSIINEDRPILDFSTFYTPPTQLPPAQSYSFAPPLNPVEHGTANSHFTKVAPYVAKPFKFTPSEASQEWDSRKFLDGETNDTLDELMQYQGLEAVKQQFLDIKSKVNCYLEQGRDLKSECFNVIFQGNPGTGKTTIARLYARFLYSLNLLDSKYVKETTGIKIATSGPTKIKDQIKKILNYRKGGVLFVDEAYQLTASYVDSAGRSALDIIMAAMENNIGKLVVIFVGYKDEMESFFEHNHGLYSRIPYTIDFTDFTDAELWKILRDNISKQYHGKMRVEGGMDGLYMRIAIRRLSQTRGSRSFGNARAVRNLLARISQRQAQRLTKEKRLRRKLDYFLFTKEDIIGPDPALAAEKSEAWTRLQELIGLNQVKDGVQDLIRTMNANYHRRELQELPPLKFSLNQLFVGNPGTGKTTVAKLYGQILADLGYLSKGDVVLKNPADFIGDCVGKSEANTKNILEATVGKVLVIDEAYMLDPGDPNRDQDNYKTGVIDTIVSMIQGVPGEDRCIVLIGYEKQIKNMFHNVNPGLSRRFPIEEPFRFENFSLSELEQILRLKMKEQELKYTEEAIQVGREILERSLMRPNFSNAGEVDKLLSKVKANYGKRISRLPPEYIHVDMDVVVADFESDNRKSQVDCHKLMEGLVHSAIIKRFVGYQERYSIAKRLGMNPRDQVPIRFIFTGHPGTGKTTTAKKMGELFYRIGFLATGDVIECSASDLLGQYVGQTVPKTRKKLQESVGRILLIDEAYRLINGQYATEAVDEIIHFLAQSENKGNMIVILAGLLADIHRLLSTRPNIESHFQEVIVFDHIPPKDCITLLSRELEINMFASEAYFFDNLTSVNYRKVEKLFSTMQDTAYWSNARDVKNLSKRIIGKFLESAKYRHIIHLRILPAELIITCMEEMIAQRNSRSSPMPQGLHVGIDSCQNSLNTQLASPSPSYRGGTYMPEVGNACSVMNRHISMKTRTQGLSHSSNSQAEAMRTRMNEIQAKGAMPRDLEDEDIGKDDVPEKMRRGPGGLYKTKNVENARRHRVNEDMKRLEQEAIGNDDSFKTIPLQNQQLEVQQEIQNEERVQEALAKMGRCVAGFVWNRVGGGYRCAGGSHFVSDGEVQSNLAK